MKHFFFFIVIIFCTPVFGKENNEKNKDPSKVIKQDLPYIKCEVCERMIGELIPAIETIKIEHNSQFKKKPIDEVKVLEIIENICHPTNDTGAWIRRQDISEKTSNKKKYLSLTEPGGIAKCQSECLTIAKSCEDLFENEIDIDDLSALFWKQSFTIDEAQERVCEKLTKRCGQFPVPVSGNYKRIDYPFVPIPEKEYEMEKMMESMKAMGLGGSMYNRDDMEAMMSGGGGFGGMPGMEGYEDFDDYADDSSLPPRPGPGIEL